MGAAPSAALCWPAGGPVASAGAAAFDVARAPAGGLEWPLGGSVGASGSGSGAFPLASPAGAVGSALLADASLRGAGLHESGHALPMGGQYGTTALFGLQPTLETDRRDGKVIILNLPSHGLTEDEIEPQVYHGPSGKGERSVRPE